MKNLVKPLSISVLLVITLSACNLSKQVLNKTHKKYEKAGFSDFTVESDSSSIYWRKVGNGDQKLLLIHGFGAASELQWEGVMVRLQEDFTMYIPDLIYFGNSTSKVDIFDPDFITRQLYQSLNTFEPEPIIVAGISFGGLVGGIFAHHYPEKTQALVLIDALSQYANRDHTDSLAHAYGYENINDILIPADGKALKALFEITYAKPKKYPACLLNKPAKTLYDSQRKEKERLLEFISEHESQLKNANYTYAGPVHIIWGAQDQIIPVSTAHRLLDFYPNAKLDILPNTGHVANMENPEKVSSIIRDLSKHSTQK